MNTIQTNNNNNNNNKHFHFTRYLYEREEVKISFLTSLLNKNEECVFWAYELYYSGYNEEFIQLLFTIYYDFYASLNPAFETYLHKKVKLLLKENDESSILLYMIVHNFMIRPFTVDVFFMKIFAKELTFDLTFLENYSGTYEFTHLENEVITLLDMEDYLTLSRVLFCETHVSHLIAAYTTCIDYFIEKKNVPLKKQTLLRDYNTKSSTHPSFARQMLFSKVMYFASLSNHIEMGKNLYVHVEPEETVLYETVEADLRERGNGLKHSVLPAYKILSVSSLYFIDEYHYLSLFRLKRDNMNIEKAYKEKWLFHASFTPLWRKRIEEYKGIVDYEKETVEFLNDSDLETFYEKYGYEPDEQTKEIQNKNIQPIQRQRTWYDFYLQFKNRGILDIDKLYFDKLDKIQIQ